VVDFYRLSGDVNHLLHALVLGIAAYDADYKRLIAGTQLFDVGSTFAMEVLKLTMALSLSYVR